MKELLDILFDKFYTHNPGFRKPPKEEILKGIYNMIKFDFKALGEDNLKAAIFQGTTGAYGEMKDFNMYYVRRCLEKYSESKWNPLKSKVQDSLPTDRDRQTGDITTWFLNFRTDTRPEGFDSHRNFEDDKVFFDSCEDWQKRKLRAWILAYRSKTKLSEYIKPKK